MSRAAPSQVRDSAEASLRGGLYCAESVVLAVARAHAIQSELLPRAATAFCSGMARTGGACGAVTGALQGSGLVLGREQAGAPVEPAYEAARRLIARFEAEFGGRDCQVLLGCGIATPEGPAMFRQQRLGERCLGFTGRAAELAAELLDARSA